jgi:hypothetical protein
MGAGVGGQQTTLLSGLHFLTAACHCCCLPLLLLLSAAAFSFSMTDER